MKKTNSLWWVPAVSFALAFALAAFVGTPLSALRLRAQATGTTCVTIIKIKELDKFLPEGDREGNELVPGDNTNTATPLKIKVSWEGGEGEKKITVTLKPSRLKGQSTNSGTRTEFDYTIEQNKNDSDWKLLGSDIRAYKNIQTIEAETSFGVQRFQSERKCNSAKMSKTELCSETPTEL